MKTSTAPLIGLAILFLVSLVGLVSQLTGIVAVGEFPLVLVLWLGALAVSGAGLGILALRGAVRSSVGSDVRRPPAAIWRDLIDTLPIGLACYDSDGRLSLCNAAWRTILADIEGLTAIGSSHDDGVIRVAGAAASDAAELAGERELASGRRVWFDETKLDDGGTLVCVRDVTGEHERLSKARSERERSRLIVSAAGAWIWETDVLHRFSMAIPVRSEWSQDDLDWMIGRSLEELQAPGGAGGDRALSKCLESMQGRRRLSDVRLALHDGTRTQAVRLSGVPRIDDDGVFLGYCGIGNFDVLSEKATSAAAAAVPPRPAGTSVPHGQRVLLVDDSQTNRLLGVSILKKMGYECDAVENGQQAVEAVREGTYGLVLMDIRMPGMDGFEATSQIRGLSGSSRSIPVVAMTAHVNPEDRRLCLESGMDDHVSKPVDRQVLSSVLHRLIGPPATGAAEDGDGATAAADAGTGDATLADAAVLEELRDNAGPELVTELIASFMTETDDRLLRMQAAMGSGDFNAVAAEAHAMKSSSGTFGAVRLQRVVERLEAAAAAGEASLVSELLSCLPRLVAESWGEFTRAGYPPPD